MKIKSWLFTSLICTAFLLGCTSSPKDSAANLTYRGVASSADLLTGSQQIVSDLKKTEIFNSNSCSEYIFKVTDYLYHIPADYMVPKTAAETDQLKKNGSAILKNLFDIRLLLAEKVKEFTAQKDLDSLCLGRIRNGMQYARFTEEYLMEWLYEQKVFTYTEQNILAHHYPSTLTNPKFKDFKIESGDVLLVRGKSYVSAMIARISDDEGNFSHLALVGEDAQGKKYVVEALIQYGTVITPLEEWVKHKDARVALYRNPDRALAQQAGRFIYGYVSDLKKRGQTIKYDFRMIEDDYSMLFCSEVAKLAYDKASGGKVIVPYYRSQMTKFAGHAYPQSMGINHTTIFSPHDFEVDPRFEFVAEFRHRPLLRQVRMQDAVLQSMYNWMEKKNYTFHWAPQHVMKSYFAMLARQFGFVKDVMPTYMPIGSVQTTLQFEGVAKHLESNIYRVENVIYTQTGILPSFQDLMKINEEFRKQDCEKQAKSTQGVNSRIYTGSDFHWYFFGKQNSCN